MLSEITVVVKNEEKRQTTKHLMYDAYSIHEDDPILKALIDDAVKEFNSEPDDIKVKISMGFK
jgi:hypothetical protein